MTYLALNLSHYINGVAKRRGEISRRMFSRYVIDAITNGVDAGTWIAMPFQELFDRYISHWRQDNFSLHDRSHNSASLYEQTEERNHPALLQQPRPVRRGHAPLHSAQWFVFQNSPDAPQYIQKADFF